MKHKIPLVLSFLIAFNIFLNAQTNAIYQNLPVGKYEVGFKIITLTDESRISTTEYNYMGEKNLGDRRKKFTIHLWYPTEANSGKRLIYEDYCYNGLLHYTNETLAKEKKDRELIHARSAIERWFGKTNDSDWKKLMETEMLAVSEAPSLKDKFPLLIGTLRETSTTIVNEMLASNGYMVCMMKDDTPGTFAEDALQQIPDLQFAINYLEKNEPADINHIGTFGFSGSGFAQVLFAMFDSRVKALADIESGIYMDQLFQSLSASNYYNPAKLQVPFLHIFSRDLSKQEKFIDEFLTKTKFSKRYRLIINQPALHHWDFAAEGYTSALMLNNRGAASSNIARSFEIASIYLLNFFNAQLKADAQADQFLFDKPSLPQTRPDFWDIAVLDKIQPAPDRDELENIIRKKGIGDAMTIVKNTIQTDSSTNIRKGYVLNSVGYVFLNERKFEEAISLFQLNVSLHPEEANWIDSMGEAYERSGDLANMKKVSLEVVNLLNKKTELSEQQKSLKTTAERRLKE